MTLTGKVFESVLDNSRKDLIVYRLDRAKDELTHSEDGLNNGLLPQSISDSYYAIFHSIRAVFAFDEKDFKKHSAVISNFQKDYVKTGVFGKEISRYIQTAFDWRSDADYQDFFVVSKEDAEEQLAHAKVVYEALKQYVESRLAATEVSEKFQKDSAHVPIL
jgi:uncharacterized protein (UPF0332 family)